MNAATIHIVDDDASVREALELLLRQDGFEVRTYGSGQQFLKSSLTGPGCIILDMRLGDMTGQDVLAVLEARGHPLPVIMLTAFGDIPSTVRAMRAGASDYLTKSNNPGQLIGRIRVLLAEAAEMDRLRANSCLGKLATLTGREREVFLLARQGLDSAVIAARLAVSLRTIEAHRSHIAKKFGVGSLAEVFRLFAEDLSQQQRPGRHTGQA